MTEWRTVGELMMLLAGALFFWVFVRLGFHQRLPLLMKRWTSINDVLEEAARRHGTRSLIELEEPLQWAASGENSEALAKTRHWSAMDTLTCTRHLAGVFAHLLRARSERIAIYKETDFDLYLFSSGALRAGAIAVPLNGHMGAAIAAAYLEYTGTTVLVTDALHWEALVNVGCPATLRHVIVTDAQTNTVLRGPASLEVHALVGLLEKVCPLLPSRELALRPGLDDPHYIVHTSGTTGVPKGVLLSGRGLLHSLRAVAVFNLISRRDRVYLALPINHQIVQLYLQAIYLLGVPTTINAHFDGTRALRALADRATTVFFGFPIAYIQLMEAGLEAAHLPRMRIWGTTADASHEVFQRAAVRQGRFFRDLGLPVDGSILVDGLGSSEVGIAALMRIVTPWTRKFGRRVGRRAPMGPRIKIANPDGFKVPVGVPGRLMIKGPCVFAGYWNAHDRLYGASIDGWWATGDIVRQCEFGELVHLDREADVIDGAQGPIYTLVLEEKLHAHPAVMDVCVFGVPSNEGHSCPAAVIALRHSHKHYPQDRLRNELQTALASHEQLSVVNVLPWSEFPMGVTGKTLKRRLRERFAASLVQTNADGTPQGKQAAA